MAMTERERAFYGGGLRGRLVRAAVERIKEKQRIEEQICLDCGIDLPATWHWDGCKRGPSMR